MGGWFKNGFSLDISRSREGIDAWRLNMGIFGRSPVPDSMLSASVALLPAGEGLPTLRSDETSEKVRRSKGGDQRRSRLEAMFMNVLVPLSLSKDPLPAASGVQLRLGLWLVEILSKDPDWLELGDEATAEGHGHHSDDVDGADDEDLSLL